MKNGIKKSKKNINDFQNAKALVLTKTQKSNLKGGTGGEDLIII